MEETRLIDANALWDEWLYAPVKEAVYAPNDVLESIDDQPTIDAVPVVRCSECKYWGAIDSGSMYHCGAIYRICVRAGTWRPLYREANAFCSDGERKDGADHG